MPDMPAALRQRLVTALGADLGTRIYPVIVPQKATMPYARYQVVSDPLEEDIDGYTSATETRVQLDIFANDYASARRIAKAAIAALAEPATVGGIRFGRVKASGPRDLGEDTENGFVNRASVDLLVWHSMA